MNTIDERLWSYIDGTCGEEERKAIDALIATDEAYRAKFEELLDFDQELVKMEADEPSMGFTYKVMESIRAEHAKQPLKAAINKNIIRGISIFFIVMISLMLVLVLSTLHLTPASFSVKLPDTLKIPDLTNILNGKVLSVFFFLDTVLALVFIDGWLRRRRSKHVLKP
ncbi:MAG TPA: hypothetical protein VG367_10885 [Mucilaginibacter sp.]|jgi:hypothetical protein|nr:hypothetical protein [Mucilaginibacter sp.]